MYNAKIVLDSISCQGVRITTFEICMPKWLVAEFNTHRMLARNSASSRAIPTRRLIKEVLDNPVIPIDFRTKNSGMGSTELLSEEDQNFAKVLWLQGRDYAVSTVEQMMRIGNGIDKQRVNRLLEPWLWTVIVATATEWENFFTLRDSPEAQPEFAYVAAIMHNLYDNNKPVLRSVHLPYVTDEDWLIAGDTLSQQEMALISAARCGRVSYYRQGMPSGLQDDIQRGESFAQNKHWSPLEHPCVEGLAKWYGPFYGWESLRATYPNNSGGSRQ